MAVGSYGDDTTPYSDFSHLKINSAKRCILYPGNNNICANIDHNTIISESKNELLGIALDSKLFFDDDIKNLCKKASQIFNTLARVAPYMCFEKRIFSISNWILSLSPNVS